MLRRAIFLQSAAFSLFSLVLGSCPEFDHGVDLATRRPLNIAHRGASGVLPENTAEAAERAVSHGADSIEFDLCVTKDARLVVLHDPYMSQTTNVEQVFSPDRQTTHTLPGTALPITDYFTVDFTLDELKQIRVNQRMSFRDPSYNGLYEIPTLEEFINAARNGSRVVGLHPELKNPDWVNSLDIIRQANTTFEDLVLGVLGRYGYSGKRDPCFIQSFSEDSIRYLAAKTELPLVLLLGVPVTDEKLLDLASFCYGIGPSKRLIVSVNVKNQIVARRDLVVRAHAVGLRVFPYTMRSENTYLAWDYGQDYVDEYEDFFNQTVDGIFTDFPHSFQRFLDAKYSQDGGADTSNTASKFNSCRVGPVTLAICLVMVIW